MALLDISDDTFKAEVLDENQKLVLVDFWAEWCGPCKLMNPILDNISKKYEESLKVCKCNVDENFAKAQEFGVASIPHIIIFKEGKKVSEFVGHRNQDDFEKELASLI